MVRMSTTTFEEARAEMAEKVRKLLAKAEDPASPPEEARSFTAKAQEIMTKYSIDLAMIADADKVDELVGKGWTVEGPYAGKKVGLISAVARTNDCRAIYAHLSEGRKHVEVIGFPSDVEWVQTLSRSLEVQLMASLAAAMRRKPAHVHGRTFAAAFVEGFIAEVNQRLQQARRDAVAAAQAAQSEPGAADGTAGSGRDRLALVLVAKAERVDEEFRVRHPRARTVYSQVRLRSWEGYGPGRAAGSRATLARGSIGGSRRRLGG
jgi:hypothetical protein